MKETSEAWVHPASRELPLTFLTKGLLRGHRAEWKKKEPAFNPESHGFQPSLHHCTINTLCPAMLEALELQFCTRERKYLWSDFFILTAPWFVISEIGEGVPLTICGRPVFKVIQHIREIRVCCNWGHMMTTVTQCEARFASEDNLTGLMFGEPSFGLAGFI